MDELILLLDADGQLRQLHPHLGRVWRLPGFYPGSPAVQSGPRGADVSDPVPSTTTAAGSRRLRNLLIGTLVGCGTVLVLAIGACVGFVVWVRQPGELIEPSRLVGDDTRGIVAWTLRLDDPGTRAFVDAALAAAEREQQSVNEQLPDPLGPLLGAYQSGRNREEMERLFPVMVAWTSHGGPDSEPLDLLTVSVERLGNRVVVADWFLAFILSRSADFEVVRHRGERVYVLPRGGAFFLRSGDVLVASSRETAERAIDLLASPPGGTSGGEVSRLLADVPADSALRGAVSAAETARILSVLAGAPVPLGAPAGCPRGALVEGGLTAGTAGEATITLLCDDAAWTAAHGDAIRAALAEGRAGTAGLDLGAEPGPRGLVLRFHTEHLLDLIGRMVSFERVVETEDETAPTE
jgi:hypothetical protein